MCINITKPNMYNNFHANKIRTGLYFYLFIYLFKLFTVAYK